LVLAIGIAGLTCAIGFLLGGYRDLEAVPERMTEWRSIAIRTSFVPVIAGAAIAGLAWMVRRDPFPGGVVLGFASAGAAALAMSDDPYDWAAELDGVFEAGFTGALMMLALGALILVVEPLLTSLERRALERPVPLPKARVVR
jgi:hypothetical protein